MPITVSEIKSRLGYAEYPGRRLLHVLNTNRIDSMSVFALELIQLLPMYNHTVQVHADPVTIDYTWMLAMQAAGANLLHCNNQRVIAGPVGYGAIVVYDKPDVMVTDDMRVVYYQYHNPPSFEPDIILKPVKTDLDHDYRVFEMPPAIRYRVFSGAHKSPGDSIFTVGIFSSGRPDKYPRALIQHFMDNASDDMRILFSPSEVPVKSTVKTNTKLVVVPKMIDAVYTGLSMSDVVIYAHEPSYTTPWGRLCFELLSSGKPVICEQSGMTKQLLKDGIHTLFFNNPGEAMQNIKKLRQNPGLGEQLGANGRLLAGRQDITAHLGTFKTVLKAVGA